MKWLQRLKGLWKAEDLVAEPVYQQSPEALTAAREMPDSRARAEALLRVLPHLAPADRPMVQREILAAVHECARNVTRWAPDAVVVPLEAQPAFAQMTAWSAAAAGLPSELLEYLVATVEMIEDEQERGWALAALRELYDPTAVARARRH